MPKSTQSYLQIGEIKHDTLVLKDGSLRAVILVSSVNFSLKAEDEQKALIAGYVTMLNTLEYSLQILIQSRKLNIDDYLNDLEEMAKRQTNELLKIHTRDYLAFVREIITIGNIMDKKFYIIVPYSPLGETQHGFFKRFKSIVSPTKIIKLKEERFLRYKDQLDKRVSNVFAALGSISLNAILLDTQGLIELFYSTYNPQVSEVQRLPNLADLQVEV